MSPKSINYAVNMVQLTSGGHFMAVEKRLVGGLMFLRWNWHETALDSTQGTCLVANPSSKHDLQSTSTHAADFKSPVWATEMLSRVHTPDRACRDMGRKALSLLVQSHHPCVSTCTAKIEPFLMHLLLRCPVRGAQGAKGRLSLKCPAQQGTRRTA